jgi:molecular chaperone DnaJ
MAERRDYYEVLGVSRDADTNAIKDAFRSLTLRYHPDRNKAPDAAEKFREIVEAYAVLSAPEKRKAYDARGVADVSGMSTEDLLGGIDLGDLFGGFGGPEGGLFDRFFGRHRQARPQRGEDLEVTVYVPLERVLLGGEEKIRLARPKACDACRGSGAKAGTTPKPCAACGGTGQHVVSGQDENVVVQQIWTCTTCGGRKTIVEEPCSTCWGRGSFEETEELTMKIPVGAEEGMLLRIAGHGLPSPDAGGVSGDLLVAIRSLPDERFVRRGADLLRVVTLSVPDAVLGTTLDVPTLKGDVKTTVHRGTQPGTVLRLRNKGLPRFGESGHGDLFIEIQIHVPESLSREEAALYAQLRACGARTPEARTST